jgi:hypothetical protein
MVMEVRLKWSPQLVQCINAQWGWVISVATNPRSSQLKRVGALIVADRSLEYLLSATACRGGSAGRKLNALKGIVPGFTRFARARAIRNRASHHPAVIRHKVLLFALLEYQRVFEVLGVDLEEKIEQAVIRRNGALMLQRYLH